MVLLENLCNGTLLNNKLEMNTVYKLTTMAALVAVNTTSLLADSIESALDDSKAKLSEAVPGKFSINSRVRYEVFDVDNGNPALDRDGTSLRVRYGYTTPNFEGFTAMVEGETLTRLGGDPADIHPLDDAGDGTDLNQLWVQYADADNGKVKVGRQIYALDDQRFIGHVGWRQNIQVFDAATFDYTGVDKLSVKGFFIDERHLVDGTHNKTDTWGLNVSYAFAPSFKLTGFYYDIEGEDAAATTSQTIGLRATGSYKIEDVKLAYSVSIAEQENDGSPLADYDAGYFAGDLAATFSGLTLGGGFEILEPSFRTPFATVHKFNGFADALLPLGGFAEGLEDMYVYAGYKIPVGNGIAFKVIYHWFDAEDSAPGRDGGEELDFVASYKINKYFNILAKYGSYESDGGLTAPDPAWSGGADKDMFTLELNFVY
jgi:hypothetical protein